MKNGAFSVTLASPAPADVGRHAAEIDAACDRFVSWPMEAPSPFRRLASVLDRVPVAVAGDRSDAGVARIRDALRARPDVVVVDFPHAGVLVPDRIEAASLLFTHNVEAEIFERHAARAKGLWKLVWSDQSRKMRAFEGATLRRFDTAIAVSDRDAEALRKRYDLPHVEPIDTGVDLDFFVLTPPAAPPPAEGGTIVFTATMSWAANVEGIHFLLDEVWPLLVRERPAMKAIVIGRNPPDSLTDKVRSRGLNVTLTGFVDDIRPYVAGSDVYVIPLWVGSGTRIKAFEAMAMGRPVVSTSLGVEGLPVVDRQHFIRADSAQAFARAILGLLGDDGERQRLATAARRLVEERFSWNVVARQFETICLDTMRRKRGEVI